MIMTLLFVIMQNVMLVIFQTISLALPVLDNTGIYQTIDNFFEIIKVGMNGFAFIFGTFPFTIISFISLLYAFYYTVFIPLRFILKTFFH